MIKIHIETNSDGSLFLLDFVVYSVEHFNSFQFEAIVNNVTCYNQHFYLAFGDIFYIHTHTHTHNFGGYIYLGMGPTGYNDEANTQIWETL